MSQIYLNIKRQLDLIDNFEPLYNSDDTVYFDRYTDGDDFENPVYIEKFRNIVYAIENQLMVRVKYKIRKNIIRKRKYCPIKIEYSDKDDKFRVICGQNEHISTLNIDRIVELEVLNEHFDASEKICKKRLSNQFIILRHRINQKSWRTYAKIQRLIKRITGKNRTGPS